MIIPENILPWKGLKRMYLKLCQTSTQIAITWLKLAIENFYQVNAGWVWSETPLWKELKAKRR